MNAYDCITKFIDKPGINTAFREAGNHNRLLPGESPIFLESKMHYYDLISSLKQIAASKILNFSYFVIFFNFYVNTYIL